MPHYFYYGSWPHDQAIEIARSSVLAVNPVNGVLEVLRKSAPVEPQAPVEKDEIPSVPYPEEPQAVQDWSNPLQESGVDPADLVSRLGLDEDLVRAAYGAGSEDHLIDLIGEAPDWQATALLELAAGLSVSEVEEKLALDQGSVDPDASEEEKIKKALEHPATKMQFTFIGEDSEELRKVIEGGDFDAWRTFLHPEQRIYAERHYNGSFRLSGGAGTGKTVVLLHRARTLSKAEPSCGVVLTTFTTTLAESLNNGLQRLDNDLHRAEKPGTAVSWWQGSTRWCPEFSEPQVTAKSGKP
ncbi:hypothetical protein GCM10017708_35240 [Arthrobacter citreus]